MRERINRLSKGFVEYGNCKMLFSCQEIRENVTAGRKETKEFRIYNEEKVSAKGLVYSTDRRVKLRESQFAGTDCRIRYDVDAARDEAETRIEGSFQIVSDFGEYKVPYTFCLTAGIEEDTFPIHTPEDFAALAEKNPEEALRLFDSERFLKLPFMKNHGFLTLYKGLIGHGSSRNSMEEFLTGSGLKEMVRVSCGTTEMKYTADNLPEKDTIFLTRNIWGFVQLEVVSDAEFLVPQQELITDRDFVNGRCELSFRIQPEKLHAGLNLGKLRVKGIYQTFEISVSVQSAADPDMKHRYIRESWLSYADHYLKLMIGNGKEEENLDEMQKNLIRIRALGDESRLTELLLSEVYLLKGRRDQAQPLLEDAGSSVPQNEKEGQIDLICYYTYVHAMFTSDAEEKQQLILRLNRLGEDPMTASDLVMILLFRLDPTLRDNPSLKLTQIKTQFRRGCRNPIIYLEACRILNLHPELLRVLDTFELQAIWFGTRRGLINSHLARSLALLSSQEREYRSLYYRILSRLYEKYQDSEILYAICSLLMKGDRREEACFHWYELGVLKDVRLTRLFEYYLYSLPKQFSGTIPRMVLLYFSYNNTLDYETQARLYGYLLDHRTEDSALFESYVRPMEEFAREQMLAGHISPDLACVYDYIFSPELIDDKMIRTLPRLVYARKLTCENPDIRYLAVCSYERREETLVPLRGGFCYLPVYLEDVRFFAQDASGNRYEGVPVTSVRLMENEQLQETCRIKCAAHPMVELLLTGKALQEKDESDAWVRLASETREREDLSAEYAAEITSELLKYYEAHLDDKDTAGFLLSLNADKLSREDRIRMMEMLTELDYSRKAYDLACSYGYEGMKLSRMVRLCNRMILACNLDYDEELLDLAFACFQGKRADSVIMEYLCRHFNGSSQDMFFILLNGQEVKADTHDLEERLLGQMLFAGTRENLDETFEAYAQKESCNENMVLAYLVVKSYRYFLSGEEMKPELVQFMKNLLREKENVNYLPPVCLMALSLWDSKQTERSAEDCILLQKMITALYRKNYVFAYYEDCAKFVRLPDELNDKILVEYRGEKAGRIQIRTKLHPGGHENPPQTMPHMYEGIFVLPVTVFYGETLEYEILDLNQNGKITAAGSVHYSSEEHADKQNRISMLNRILVNMENGSGEELKKALVDYGTLEGLVEAIFQPM